MRKTLGIILAAGRGTRMQSEKPKQFLPLLGKPMFLYSVEVFKKTCDRVLLVTGKENLDEAKTLLKEAGFFDVPVIAGGENRYESSRIGISEAEKEADEDDIVLIHDAARPLVTKEIILASIEKAEQFGSGVAAVPSKDTVKVADADGRILDTPDRRTLYQAQTPQSFRLGLISEAYRKSFQSGDLSSVTDDASVLERFSDVSVYLSAGDYENMKVTTPVDLFLAEFCLRNRNQK